MKVIAFIMMLVLSAALVSAQTVTVVTTSSSVVSDGAAARRVVKPEFVVGVPQDGDMIYFDGTDWKLERGFYTALKALIPTNVGRSAIAVPTPAAVVYESPEAICKALTITQIKDILSDCYGVSRVSLKGRREGELARELYAKQLSEGPDK